MKLSKASALRGRPALPADKSISHRAAMISSISRGETLIHNFSTSADCGSTLKCLEKLGVDIAVEDRHVRIKGTDAFDQTNKLLDCGNSGTTIRLLAGIVSGHDIETTLTGDSSLRTRPMKRVAEPLQLMGALISTEDGHAPLVIRGRNPLMAIEYRLSVASAQLKSAVLFAGLRADGKTTVIEPVPTRDHTERMLRLFGIVVRSENQKGERHISVARGRPISPGELRIPYDISASAFFLVGAACLPGSDITISNVGINPARAGIIEVLNGLGLGIEVKDLRDEFNEPVGTLRIRSAKLSANDSGRPVIQGAIVPNIIDEIPIIAVLGTQLPFGIEIRDAGELRHKESDRIRSIVSNLAAMGAAVEEFPDGLRIERSYLKGSVIDSFGDHRIAMAFSIAALLAEGDTEIKGAECAAVSFPGFFDTLANIAC